MSIFDRLVLVKTETVNGTDSVPTSALNAIRVKTAKITPNIESIDIQVMKNTMGNLPHMIGKKTATAEIEIDLKGSGVAGTAPEMAALLKACGLVETISAGVDVSYQPSTTANQTVTIYIYMDGLLWKLLGGKGKMTFDTTIGQTTTFKFSMQALYTAPTPSALPSGAAYQNSQPIISDNLDIATESLANIKVASLSFDDGNDLQEHYIIGEHSFQISQRQPSASITKDSIGTTAEWNNLINGLDAAIHIEFGNVGNKFIADFPIARKKTVTYAERAERDIYEISYGIYENLGDDQYVFKFA